RAGRRERAGRASRAARKGRSRERCRGEGASRANRAARKVQSRKPRGAKGPVARALPGRRGQSRGPEGARGPVGRVGRREGAGRGPKRGDRSRRAGAEEKLARVQKVKQPLRHRSGEGAKGLSRRKNLSGASASTPPGTSAAESAPGPCGRRRGPRRR